MKAYVLVSTRKPGEMKEYLEGVKGVREVHIVYGSYDVIVVIEVSTPEELGRIVLREIRGRFPVEETLTLVVAE